MQLTPHFYLEELTKSQTGDRTGIDNVPGADSLDNLKMLCERVLEPVRLQFGPVFINSGYRCPELNKAIGGATTSQHCLGQAADIEVSGVANGDVAAWIAANLDYDQVILECYRKGQPNSGWVHVSYKTTGNRKTTLTATVVEGRMVYFPGLRV
jgi:zinc D-Ala-D-Ala carboxypeptidase